MGFKEDILDDLNHIFGENEISEEHLVDEVPMQIILNSNSLNKLKGIQNADYDGIFLSELAFAVRKSDLKYEPVIDSLLNLDGRVHRVKQVTEHYGLTRIVLWWDEE